MVTDQVKIVDAVRAGRVDWAGTPLVPSDLAALRRHDPALVRDVVGPWTAWVWLNTRVAPFDRADARRAVSLAIDRRAVVAAFRGNSTARATCHVLPPTVAGYRPGCPAGPRDLATARRLVTRSGTRGARVTLWSGTEFDPLAPVLAGALRTLGYRTSVRRLPMEQYFPKIADSRTRAQIGTTAWVADYPSPATFLSNFSCRALRPRSSDNINYSQYCDPGADALMQRAGALEASDPHAADALWARTERRVLRAAPVVPLFNLIQPYLVSARVRNDQYSPQWGMLLDQAWVR
jgi:peptide/nickel transport system substrate-binding protein